MIRSATDFLLFQAVWFAAVLGAGHGHDWFGPMAVVVFAAVHLSLLSRSRRLDALTMAAAMVVGPVADITLARLGFLSFGTWWFTPPFLVALWGAFALTLSGPLGWLRGRLMLAAAFGAIGGAAAYVAGDRLGAIRLAAGFWPSTIAVALEWAIVLPCLIFLQSRIARLMPPPQREDKQRAGEGDGQQEGVVQ